ncbi:MAG TPA: metallophosphoesterase [Propionibacteriaceae bacterium]
MRSRRVLAKSVTRALLTTVVAAVAAAPFAAAWGVGHARVDDYLGPLQASFASNYGGEVRINLGPLGNAYLPSPAGPVGVEITVGSIGTAADSLNSLFSEQTLAAFTALYNEPDEAVGAIVDRLAQDALVESAKVEVLLLLAFAVWRLRGQLLAPWVVHHLTRRRAGAIYLTVVALVVGSILVPQPPVGTRISVSRVVSARIGDVTVDSVVLADLLDRGIKGVTLLSQRQQKSVDTYIDGATASLSTQLARTPEPRFGETMIMGFSDLHCNEATTELITRLERLTRPRAVLSSGDDTVNGTAVERGCIRREAAIASGPPIVVATGNHDSDVTETQMRANGMTVLDGAPVTSSGLEILGDDDPEHNIPFSVERTRDRPETEEELGQRMVDVARVRRTDVILVHQPAASAVIMATPNPPAALVLWGHFHAQVGPTVVTHDDGTWTVGMQQGTAGGVKQPTITSFSTPFSPPLISADVYFYFRDDATGLITGVQPVHFLPDASVVIDPRIPTGDLGNLSTRSRERLEVPAPTPTPAATR